MTLNPQKRPYVDDPIGLVKSRRRFAVLQLAAVHELFFVPDIPDAWGTFTYEPALGDIELIDPDLTWTIREMEIHQYLSRTSGPRHEQMNYPTSLLINDRGAAALARWEKSERKRR